MFVGECLAEPSVDVTVQGQGEATLGEIVERLARGDSLEGCLGCAFVADGQPRFNPPRPMQALDGFRPHDYGLIDVERYYRLKGKRQLDYISSQGCHFRCGFCADPFVFQRRWEGLSPARMGQEIESLWQRYGFPDLSFHDETFFTHEPRVEAIAEEFLRRKLPTNRTGESEPESYRTDPITANPFLRPCGCMTSVASSALFTYDGCPCCLTEGDCRKRGGTCRGGGWFWAWQL
jgi:radical SAM superfamily enzyme YgiQ (UPF0313 family)